MLSFTPWRTRDKSTLCNIKQYNIGTFLFIFKFDQLSLLQGQSTQYTVLSLLDNIFQHFSFSQHVQRALLFMYFSISINFLYLPLLFDKKKIPKTKHTKQIQIGYVEKKIKPRFIFLHTCNKHNNFEVGLLLVSLEDSMA